MAVKVVIRADASTVIGSGHVMRCLTLAEGIREAGGEVLFVCFKGTGDLTDAIEKKGFPVERLHAGTDDARQTADLLERIKPEWLIIDHYGWGESLERKMRPFVGGIMVIDDLANRSHDCDVLLDQNFVEGMEERYHGLVPEHCQMLLGPRYLLLRPSFPESRSKLQRRDGRVKRLLVTYGGSDPTGETEKVLRMMRVFRMEDIRVDVVTGRSNPRRENIVKMCGEFEFHCHEHLERIEEVMAETDLCFGAGGVSMWERCFLGLPTITTAVAENQVPSVEAAAKYGTIWNAGWHERVDEKQLAALFDEAIEDPEALKRISENAMNLTEREADAVHPAVRLIMRG